MTAHVLLTQNKRSSNNTNSNTTNTSINTNTNTTNGNNISNNTNTDSNNSSYNNNAPFSPKRLTVLYLFCRNFSNVSANDKLSPEKRQQIHTATAYTPNTYMERDKS